MLEVLKESICPGISRQVIYAYFLLPVQGFGREEHEIFSPEGDMDSSDSVAQSLV